MEKQGSFFSLSNSWFDFVKTIFIKFSKEYDNKLLELLKSARALHDYQTEELKRKICEIKLEEEKKRRDILELVAIRRRLEFIELREKIMSKDFNPVDISYYEKELERILNLSVENYDSIEYQEYYDYLQSKEQ